MNLGALTREQKMLGAAAANGLFIISLFLSWLGAGAGDFSVSLSGSDLPSWWILLAFAAVAAAALASDALAFDLPTRLDPLAVGAYCSSIPLVVTLMYFLDTNGASRKFGIFLALLFSIVATALAVIAWREETRAP